jgi:hypothetical protein
MPSLETGSTFGDGGALRHIDKELFDRLSEADPTAAGTFRELVSAATFRRGMREWCVWGWDLSEADIARSRFLSERCAQVRATRTSHVPPWLFERVRQPQEPYFALPKVLRRGSPVLALGCYNPDIVVNDEVWVVGSSDAQVTAGVLMSRVYRVWVETVGAERRNGDLTIGVTSVHNTFPCPVPTRRQRERIEEAVDGVLVARGYAQRPLDALYGSDGMPRPLARAHAELDAAVDNLFGFRAATSDEEVARELLARYAAFTSGGA